MNIYDELQLKEINRFIEQKEVRDIEKKKERIKRLKIEYKCASGGRRMRITKTIKRLEDEIQSENRQESNS